MGILKQAGDLVYTFRFLKLLTTKFEDTDAFKLGIIDKDGKRNKSVSINTSEQKDAYTPFHRLVFNVKRIMAKVPGGSSSLASYAAALYLIKENYISSERKLGEVLEEHTDISTEQFLNESSSWFIVEDRQLAPGNYRLRNEKVINSNYEPLAKANDRIVVEENSRPVGSIFGLDVYEAIHYNSKQKVYITVGEIYK